MGQSNVSAGLLSRLYSCGAPSSPRRIASRLRRSLIGAWSLTFVFMLSSLLTLAADADAHRASHVRGHHVVKNFHRGHHKARHRRRKHHTAHRRHHTRLRVSGHVSPGEAAVVSGVGPCPNVNLVPNASNIPAVVQATLCLVNQQRRAAGEAPLTEDTRLDQAAQAHSNDMVGHGYFEHVSPSGSSPLQRMMNTGYVTPSDGYQIGENIAWGTLGLATPASIVSDWMHSAGHRANILDRGFRQAGMGIARSVPGRAGGGQAGATYTQDFGTVQH